jgi:hypothetical protein
MRRNTQKRTVLVCVVCSLLLGYVLAPWEAVLIQPGMTRGEVEEYVGSKGENALTYFSDYFPPRGITPEEEAKEFRDFRRRIWRVGYRYEALGGDVIVTYHAPDEVDRVLQVEGRRKITLSILLYLLPWAIVGALVGLAASEVVRNRRPAIVPASLNSTPDSARKDGAVSPA